MQGDAGVSQHLQERCFGNVGLQVVFWLSFVIVGSDAFEELQGETTNDRRVACTRPHKCVCECV